MFLHRTRQFHSSALSAALSASTRPAAKKSPAPSAALLNTQLYSAYVKVINEKTSSDLRSLADAFALIRDIERRYGTVREYVTPKDCEVNASYQPFALIAFRDPESFKRLAAEPKTHSFARPSVDHDRPGGLGLDDIELLLKAKDLEVQEQGSSIPRFDDSETSHASDGQETISYTIEPASSDFFSQPPYKSQPLLSSTSQNFLRWGGFHVRKPIPAETPLHLGEAFAESDIDQFRMRAALRHHSQQLNVPNPYETYPNQGPDVVSLEWEPLPGHESTLKDTPMPSNILTESEPPKEPKESNPIPPAPSTPVTPPPASTPAPPLQATPIPTAESVPPAVPESVVTAQAVADKMHAQAKSMTRRKDKDAQRRKQKENNPLPDLSNKKAKTQAQAQTASTPLRELRKKSIQARQAEDVKRAAEPKSLKDKVSGFFSGLF